jgi:uncharacterized protein YuzE
MKIRYDAEVDALSIVFREITVTAQKFAEGIYGEYDALGRLAGIEILDAAKRLGDSSLLSEVSLQSTDPVHGDRP